MSRRFLDDASRPQASRPGGSEEQDPLITLVDIGRALASQLDLRQALERALEYLERDCSIVRAAVLMLDEESGDIRIEVSLGFSAETRHARYRLGEGITGRVVESGHPIVVPAMSREPLFLHRSTERRGDQTLICVPISVEHEPAGALAVDLEYRASRDYDAALRFFTVVASMMAQACKARRSIGQSRKKLLDENRHLLLQLQHRYDLSGIVGNSGPMRQVCEQIARLAPTDGTVLIRGERGSGKELIAETIHYGSRRARKPLVKVRVAGLPDTAAESVLFGQEESTPTGAPAPRRGSFEMAEGGTLFLDDVCQLNGVTQAKLLRALQEREFERMGGSETVKTNVRLVAATSRSLEERVRSGLFREDLYYRLNVVPIFLPPLRDRESDIMLLVDHFIARYSQQHGKAIRRVSAPAIDLLVTHHWPGNVRELENTIEQAVLACDGEAIHGHHLPPSLQTAEAAGTAIQTSLGDAVERFEKDLILDAIKSSRGNIAGAARLLNTTERIIGYKLRKYCIDPQRFRSSGSPATAAAPASGEES